jgi:hypothetical protein
VVDGRCGGGVALGLAISGVRARHSGRSVPFHQSGVWVVVL